MLSDDEEVARMLIMNVHELEEALHRCQWMLDRALFVEQTKRQIRLLERVLNELKR
jgi:hypothetical protein